MTHGPQPYHPPSRMHWQDPAVLLLSARAFQFAVCVCFGVYVWEFLQSLDFDWIHLTRKRAFRWTFVPYFIARYFLLLALIFGMRIINVFEPIDCLMWNRLIYASAHLCIALASLLLALRVFAISEKNVFVGISLGLFYLVNVGSLIHGVTQVEAIYVAPLYMCGATNTVASRLNMWIALAFDTACLLIMLFCLLRVPGGNFWKFLVHQGFGYFAVVTTFYLLCVVFLTLNLNDAINELPQTVGLTAMVMCATRMYRNLATYDLEGIANKSTPTWTATEAGHGMATQGTLHLLGSHTAYSGSPATPGAVSGGTGFNVKAVSPGDSPPMPLFRVPGHGHGLQSDDGHSTIKASAFAISGSSEMDLVDLANNDNEREVQKTRRSSVAGMRGSYEKHHTRGDEHEVEVIPLEEMYHDSYGLSRNAGGYETMKRATVLPGHNNV